MLLSITSIFVVRIAVDFNELVCIVVGEGITISSVGVAILMKSPDENVGCILLIEIESLLSGVFLMSDETLPNKEKL